MTKREEITRDKTRNQCHINQKMNLSSELISKIYLYDLTYRNTYEQNMKELKLVCKYKIFRYFFHIVLYEFKLKYHDYKFRSESLLFCFKNSNRRGSRFSNFKRSMTSWIRVDMHKLKRIRVDMYKIRKYYVSYEKYLLECFQVNIHFLNDMFNEDFEKMYKTI